MTIENQIQNSTVNYIKNTILSYKGNENDWILWNGAIIKIVETMWEGNRLLYPNFKCKGTIAEAKYAIEYNNLLEFLTSPDLDDLI